MANALKHIELLYEQQLYSNVIKACDITLTICEHKPDYCTSLGKFQVTLYYADALYYTQQYAQAEPLYRQALQARKVLINKSKTNNKIVSSQRNVSGDVDIKYKIYVCCVAIKQKKAAADILQSVTAKQRTPKINMALGNIYKEVGMERSAITCFKEVLRECPLALEAIENLLKLGINGVEVNTLVVDASSENTWLGFWVRAQAQTYSKDYSNAIQTYKKMDSHALLKNNAFLLVNMAYCYHYMCEDAKAISLLQRVIKSNPNTSFGRDLLSTLLASSGNKEHQRSLENLTSNTDSSLWCPEHWVALGNLMLYHKKYDRAAYAGMQACLIDRSKNVEALLLKANALFNLKKYREAATHCTEALQICPFRYDLHKCLIDCYLSSNRLREAETMALNACKELNNSPQAYCLHASCLLKDPGASTRNVRRILEKACEQDKTGQTQAVYMLADLLIREQQFDQAVQILSKALDGQTPTSRLHQLLGECYANLQKDDEAFDHYTIALRMDPQNQRATEGLNNIGKSVPPGKREQYYSCIEESCSSRRTNSDHEADAESDTELWPGSVDMANFDT